MKIKSTEEYLREIRQLKRKYQALEIENQKLKRNNNALMDDKALLQKKIMLLDDGR